MRPILDLLSDRTLAFAIVHLCVAVLHDIIEGNGAFSSMIIGNKSSPPPGTNSGSAKMTVAILGLGNTLMSDGGIGVHALERLRAAYAFPADVRLLDGGTKDIELVGWLEGVDCLLVIGAVSADQPPGTLVRLTDDDLPPHPGLTPSPHQMGLRGLLAALELLDRTPAEIVLWGMEPASLEVGVGLTPTVAAQMDALVTNVLGELRKWGVEPWPLKESARRGANWRPPVVADEKT